MEKTTKLYLKIHVNYTFLDERTKLTEGGIFQIRFCSKMKLFEENNIDHLC